MGRFFISYVLNRYPGDQVICLDCLTDTGKLFKLKSVTGKKNIHFVGASITDKPVVYRVFATERPDAVVSFAAGKLMHAIVEAPGTFPDTHATGTVVLVDACRKYGVGRYHLQRVSRKQ